jgi:hypothetical protein
MWLALDRTTSEANGADPVVPSLEAILQFAAELRRRLGGSGVDGIGGALELERRLRAVFDGIGVRDIEGAMAEATALTRTFEEMARTLETLRWLKTSS